MQKITPFLWFNNQAEEAANFYSSVFDNSKVGETALYGEEGPGPNGTVMSVTFEIDGQEFYALNGGPQFTFTPALSFFAKCRTEKEIDELFNRLSKGGTVLMELDNYPFSKKFGWLNDQFGVSWQLYLPNETDNSIKQKITPFLMFVGEKSCKAEEAIKYYTSLFENSKIDTVVHYSVGEGEPEGAVKHARFSLNGQEFMAMDSSLAHQFTFTPAISFFVNCETQAEVDDLWEKLSKGGEEQQCGWLQDKYGVTWQIVPEILGRLLHDADRAKSRRVMKAMLQMDKLDIESLKQAYEEI